MNNVWYTSLSPVKEAYFNCIGRDAGGPTDNTVPTRLSDMILRVRSLV